MSGNGAHGAGPRSVLSTPEGQNRGAFTLGDWGLFASIGGIWGASFLFIAVGLEAFEPGVITWARVSLGAAVLWLFPAARTPVPAADRQRLVAVSVIARVGATRGAFAIYLTPVVALILGVVFLDERVHAEAIVGVALVIAGAILASRKETKS